MEQKNGTQEKCWNNFAQPSIYYSLRKAILCSIDNAFFWTRHTLKSVSVKASAHEAVQQFNHQHGYFSSYQPLACLVTSHREHAAICIDFLAKMALYIDDRELLQFAVLEFLVKVLAYRSLSKGEKIFIPGEGEYFVDAVLSIKGGIPIYGLYSPANQKGILLFRGTELSWSSSGRASMRADLDWYGPGCSLYLSHRHQIRSWLKGKQAFALGHSLGGALAYYTALFESDLMDSERPSIAFHPPGLYKEALLEWKKKEKSLLMKTYTTEEDFVSKFGKLPGEVQFFHKKKRLRPIAAHTTLLFVEPIS